MKVCPTCNEIVFGAQDCKRSDCPNLSASAAPVAKVEPGATGRADKAVQQGLDRLGDGARESSRRALFAVAAVCLVALFAALYFFNDNKYATSSSSIQAVKVYTLVQGSGSYPKINDVALINYRGLLPDGKVFDEGRQAALPLKGVIPGFTQALEQMQRGGKYKVWIPAKLAYGDHQTGPVPPNTDLTFEIELIDFKGRIEFERQR